MPDTSPVYDLADDSSPFNPRDWIGRGKKYEPLTCPALEDYLDHLRIIPHKFQSDFIPTSCLPVHHLLHSHLLRRSGALISKAAAKWYQTAAPNCEPHVLGTRILPPNAVVKALNCHMGQAILDGARSVEDPRHPGSYYPIWVIHAWSKLHKMLDVHQMWKYGWEWVSALEAKVLDDSLRVEVTAVQLALTTLPWNEPMDTIPGGGHISTDALSRFLSNAKMTTFLVDAMIGQLKERLESCPGLDEEIVLEDLVFQAQLQKSWKGKDWVPTKYIRRLQTRITDSVKRLEYPVYLEDIGHFVGMRVNFSEGTIAYGDGLSHKGIPPPKDVIRNVTRWMKEWRGVKMTNVGDNMIHGIQDDWIECGILAVNTIAQDIFGDEVWTPQRRDFDRVHWFNVLSNAFRETKYKEETFQSTFIATGVPPNRMSIPDILNPAASGKLSIDDMLNPQTASADDFFELPPFDIPMDVDMTQAMYDDMSGSELPGDHIQTEVLAEVESAMMIVDSQATRKRPYPDMAAYPPPKRQSSSSLTPSPRTDTLLPSNFAVDTFSESDDSDRSVHESDTGNDSDVDPPSSRPVGMSKSAIWERQQRTMSQEERERPCPRLSRFTQSILAIDQHASIVDAQAVRCSKCGNSKAMKYPYNTGNFKEHYKKCKGPPKTRKLNGAGMLTLNSFFKERGTTTSSPVPRLRDRVPCPGLGVRDNAKIPGYLDRTGASGGGARSVNYLSRLYFGKSYRYLSKLRKDTIHQTQRNMHKWSNDHGADCVFSTKCTGSAAVSDTSGFTYPCGECSAVKKSRAFQNALAVKRPPIENYKYIPHHLRMEKAAVIFSRCVGLEEIMTSTDPENTPCIRYAKGVLSGDFKKSKQDQVFGQFLTAMVTLKDKEKRGVGKQNFKYAPDLIEVAHIAAMMSPRCYRFLQQFIPLPEVRTLQIQRSHQPTFPIGIQPRCFEMARYALDSMQYDGPMGLMCDDTKLHPAFRPYFDRDRGSYCILGSTGEPLLLSDPAEFEAILKEAKLKKATKIRTWCIQAPLPKTPTIVVAALAIADNNKAPDLLPLLVAVLDGLWAKGIKVRSYATDGASVERSVSTMMMTKATRVQNIEIYHPGVNAAKIQIPIYFFGEHPLAFLQDSNHFAKTMRNQPFSGARCLTFPNNIVMYSQFRDIAFSGGPLFHRDVEKVDRQDDNAATRVFSGHTLAWLAEHRPEEAGLIVYLFVFGELVDAYQNRFLPLIDRIQMVLRAKFFVELWLKFLEKAKYKKSRHFISHEAEDIIQYMVNGLIQLVIIYRDHVGDARIPLLIWILMTEICEHLYSATRGLIPDFHHKDFQVTMPKAMLQLREAVLSQRFSDGKETANGYNHGYTDTRGIDLAALSTYPSNTEIDDASRRGFSEAENLFAILGVSSAELEISSEVFPGLKSWWTAGHDKAWELDSDDDESDESDGGESDDEGIDIQEALDTLEDVHFDLQRDESDVLNHHCAAISLEIDREMMIRAQPEMSTDELEEAWSQDAQNISAVLTTLPPPLKPKRVEFDPSLACTDFDELVKTRRAHHRKQADTGVRKVGNPEPVDIERLARGDSAKHQLEKRYQALINTYAPDKKRVTTGTQRDIRWTKADDATGNTLNAQVATGIAATRALARRKRLISEHVLPAELGDARVSPQAPLHVADIQDVASSYGIVFYNGGLFIARIEAIFAKTTGKNARHASFTEASNVAGVSYLNVQLFDEKVGQQFTSFLKTCSFQIKQYAHLHSDMFLCALESKPVAMQNGLKISKEDHLRFQSIRKVMASVTAAVKSLRGRKRDDEPDEEED